MSLYHVAHNLKCAYEVLFTWGIGTNHIALRGIDIWLIDGYPKIAEVAECPNGVGDVAHKEANVLLVGKAPPVCKPQSHRTRITSDARVPGSRTYGERRSAAAVER